MKPIDFASWGKSNLLAAEGYNDSRCSNSTINSLVY
jgi:hypothetical protein